MEHHQIKQCLHYGNPNKGKKEKRTENILKAVMAEKLPNLGKEMDNQIHEAKRPQIG